MTQAMRRTNTVVACQSARKVGTPRSKTAPGQSHRANPPSFVRDRILLLKASVDEIELRLRIFESDLRTKLADDVQVVDVAPGRGLGVEPERRPELGAIGIVETLAGDADDFVLVAVEANGLSNRAGVAAETPLEKLVAQDHGPRAVLRGIRCERAARIGLDSEGFEVVGRHERALEPLRLAACRRDSHPTTRGPRASRKRSRALSNRDSRPGRPGPESSPCLGTVPHSMTRRSMSGMGKGRSTRASTIEKTAVFAPIPRPRVTTTMMVAAGAAVRALRPSFTSRRSALMRFPSFLVGPRLSESASRRAITSP